jgi:hypothetical protein
VLHTWTRQMLHHPHLHVIMPGVALSADGLRLKRAKGDKYLFPVKALGAAFRNRLRRLIEERDAREGASLMQRLPPHLWRAAWVVDAQAVGDGTRALRYLARYASRSALSESRLLGYAPDGRIRLKCQRSDSGRWQEVLLTPHEFLRRWSLHVLPKGLIRSPPHGSLTPAGQPAAVCLAPNPTSRIGDVGRAGGLDLATSRSKGLHYSSARLIRPAHGADGAVIFGGACSGNVSLS